MQFSLPTDFNDALPERLEGLEVRELFGAIPNSPIGHEWLFAPLSPEIPTEKIARHIRRVRDFGLDFNVLMGAPCFGNREFDIFEKEKLVDHLKRLADQGASSITAANGFLIELVKHHVPSLKVVVSMNGFVDTVERARLFIGLGADALTISPHSNRDFRFLKFLRSAFDGELRIIANTACVFQCPVAQYHALSYGHGALSPIPLRRDGLFESAFDVAPSAVETEIIKAGWIRPEDLEFYTAAGYSFFVIAGTRRPTDWLIDAASAYANARRVADLTSLLCGPCFDKVAHNLKIDGAKLDGFLDFFMNTDCRNSCFSCDHCNDTAKRAVSERGAESQGRSK